MEKLETQQLDMFDGFISAEFVHGEKIRKLEEQQTNLRKGLFGRWKAQELKIQALSESLSQVLHILETDNNYG
jgi:hypothetical protein